MLLISCFTFLVPFAVATPLAITASAPPPTEPHTCGYVTFGHLNAYGSVYSTNQCTGLNHDMVAYKMWGGCECWFYTGEDKCVEWMRSVKEDKATGRHGVNAGSPAVRVNGTTSGELQFPTPKPKWYYCGRE